MTAPSVTPPLSAEALARLIDEHADARASARGTSPYAAECRVEAAVKRKALVASYAALLSEREALTREVEALGEDKARLDWLNVSLHPLPWGGVFATIEADGETSMRVTVQPSSGDAPHINETGPTLRAAIDAARSHPRTDA